MAPAVKLALPVIVTTTLAVPEGGATIRHNSAQSPFCSLATGVSATPPYVRVETFWLEWMLTPTSNRRLAPDPTVLANVTVVLLAEPVVAVPSMATWAAALVANARRIRRGAQTDSNGRAYAVRWRWKSAAAGT